MKLFVIRGVLHTVSTALNLNELTVDRVTSVGKAENDRRGE